MMFMGLVYENFEGGANPRLSPPAIPNSNVCTALLAAIDRSNAAPVVGFAGQKAGALGILPLGFPIFASTSAHLPRYGGKKRGFWWWKCCSVGDKKRNFLAVRGFIGSCKQRIWLVF
jgi:hypothetical protein